MIRRWVWTSGALIAGLCTFLVLSSGSLNRITPRGRSHEKQVPSSSDVGGSTRHDSARAQSGPNSGVSAQAMELVAKTEGRMLAKLKAVDAESPLIHYLESHDIRVRVLTGFLLAQHHVSEDPELHNRYREVLQALSSNERKWVLDQTLEIAEALPTVGYDAEKVRLIEAAVLAAGGVSYESGHVAKRVLSGPLSFRAAQVAYATLLESARGVNEAYVASIEAISHQPDSIAQSKMVERFASKYPEERERLIAQLKANFR